MKSKFVPLIVGVAIAALVAPPGVSAQAADPTAGARATTASVGAPAAERDRDRKGRKGGHKHAGKNGDGKHDGKKGKKRKPDRFKPEDGLTFTSPFHDPYGINAKIIEAIKHTRAGSTIKLMTWNFDAWTYMRTLRYAHQRGVRVRMIMARTLFNEQGPNGPAKTLQRALSVNKGRAKQDRSWLRTCQNSCRGKGGAMHSKFTIFSKTGRARNVVMSASANLTATAGAAQWNDLVTLVGRPKSYAAYEKIFDEAAKDKEAPYYQARDGNILHWFYPRLRKSDMVMDMLNAVKCSGAVGAGIDGKTSLRIAQDVFNGKRGVVIAKKIRSLHSLGCNVKVVFSQAVGGAGAIIAQVPNNHLVQDRDGDGAYDIYLHAKALAISGNYGGDPGRHIVLNGTANWSGLAVNSDEQGMIIEGKGYERKYGEWVNKMFDIKLTSARPNPFVPRAADPYMNMER